MGSKAWFCPNVKLGCQRNSTLPLPLAPSAGASKLTKRCTLGVLVGGGGAGLVLTGGGSGVAVGGRVCSGTGVDIAVLRLLLLLLVAVEVTHGWISITGVEVGREGMFVAVTVGENGVRLAVGKKRVEVAVEASATGIGVKFAFSASANDGIDVNP